MHVKMEKIAMISDSYHDFVQLLLLTIIVNSKNQTISITVKENITVNKQNRLIPHPYIKPSCARNFSAGRVIFFIKTTQSCCKFCVVF